MKIILTGASGFTGTRLVERLSGAGHNGVLLTRNPDSFQASMHPTMKIDVWDGKTQGSWVSHVDGADAVLNFAGESIGGKRWTTRQKGKILNSRIDATKAVIEAIRRAKKKPSVLVNASAVGYYGPLEDDEVTEGCGKGRGFLADVCGRWEEEACVAEQLGVRVVILRQGVVIDRGGGALEKMAFPFRMFAGGPVGSGRQWFPWVHRDDIVNVALFAIGNKDLSGPVNVAAPESVTMKQFCSALGKAMHRPSWAPVPAFVLKLALGEMSGMLLTGQRVVPSKLSSQNFFFQFPKLDDALRSIFPYNKR